MRRSDYKLIALALRRDRERGNNNDFLVEMLAGLLAQENPRFKREMFFEKIGYEPAAGGDNG